MNSFGDSNAAPYPSIFDWSDSLDAFLESPKDDDVDGNLELSMDQIQPTNEHLLAVAPVEGQGASIERHSRQETSTAIANERRRSFHRKKLPPQELRRRRTERQIRYRKRLRNEAEIAEVDLESKNSKLVALRNENTALSIASAALHKIVSYMEDIFNTCSSVAGVVQQAVSNISAARHFANSLFDLIVARTLIPSDTLISQVVTSRSVDEIETIVLTGQRRMAELFRSWEANPASRRAIESHIDVLQEIRTRVALIFARDCPEVGLEIVRRISSPLGPDGEPSTVMRNALASAELQPDQIQDLKRLFYAYKAEVQEARELASAALSKAMGQLAWETHQTQVVDETQGASAAAGKFLSNMEAVSALDAFPMNEGVALLTLFSSYVRTLTAVQRGRMAVHCSPYLPDPLQVFFILFQEKSK